MTSKLALQALRSGGLVLYPSDTVWSIGCDATRSESVSQLRTACQIPAQQGLIVLLWDVSVLDRYVVKVPEIAYDLIEFAEDPLTVVFPQGKNVSEHVLAPDGSIAIRVVKDSVALELVQNLGRPLVSTLASSAGEAIPSTLEQISPAIKAAAQEIVTAPAGWKSAPKPSRIVRLGLGGEFEFLRK